MSNYDEALRRIEEAKATGKTELNFSHMWLPDLPPDIWKLTKLEVLNLSRNQLTALPTEIGKLTKLELLYLFGNPINDDDEMVVELKKNGVFVYIYPLQPTL